jgi:hypothetical protein
MISQESKRDVFDYYTGIPIGEVKEEIFEIYLDQINEAEDEIGAVRGDYWGFPGKTIFMW